VLVTSILEGNNCGSHGSSMYRKNEMSECLMGKNTIERYMGQF